MTHCGVHREIVVFDDVLVPLFVGRRIRFGRKGTSGDSSAKNIHQCAKPQLILGEICFRYVLLAMQ